MVAGDAGLQHLPRLHLRQLLAAQAELAAQGVSQRIGADADDPRTGRHLEAHHLTDMNARRQLAIDQHGDVATATTQAEVPRHHHLAGVVQRLLVGQHPLGSRPAKAVR